MQYFPPGVVTWQANDGNNEGEVVECGIPVQIGARDGDDEDARPHDGFEIDFNKSSVWVDPGQVLVVGDLWAKAFSPADFEIRFGKIPEKAKPTTIRKV